MKQFKYQLDTSSKKFNCPQCGKKRFVKFVDTETGHYAESQYGRCDREIKCGYMSNPYNNSKVSFKCNASKPIETSYMDKDIFIKSLSKYDKNHLTAYLFSQYNKNEVIKAIDKYNIGTANSFNGGTVFWQMDNTGNIRTGKIMAYDSTTGKRIKDKDIIPITWVHSILKKPKESIRQCLFGLHLLNDNIKQVAIVESEKTAIIMSIELPQFIWMATGSLNGFKYEYLKLLKSKEIIAFPDKGCYDKWNTTAHNLNGTGFNIRVSKLLEIGKYEMGWDLVDVLNYESK